MNKSLLQKCLTKPVFVKIDVRQKHARPRVNISQRSRCPCPCPPQHLICFAQWTAKMVKDVLISATNLKKSLRGDSHFKKMDFLNKAKVMILQEENEPVLNMAVSKAASLLGAESVNIVSPLAWEQDYNGKIFSEMADVIFVTTKTHMCIMRFAEQSSVPVICMRSRTHASIQSLATIMSIMEERRTLKCANLCYIGPSHPVLNSYLLLCPLLGANIKYKNCCSKVPVSPLTLKLSEALCEKSSTHMEQCLETTVALKDAYAIIAGPTTQKKEKLPEFTIKMNDISCATKEWVFYHTCPRGAEVDDQLFWHANARTFTAFQNMQYIAAALMAYTVKKFQF